MHFWQAIRKPRGSELVNIEKRISVARSTSYSLMNTGLHGANGLSPEVSYQIYKTYVIPWLIYGLNIIPLTKSTDTT